jgi:drug/metabolite transporter (DMT)-like permease
MTNKNWLLYALAIIVLWGVWGAFIGLPVERGFPETLVYCVWSVTMIIPWAIVSKRANWRFEHDSKSILFGMLIGLLGAGGQLILFYAAARGPAYLIFPLISLSPMVTILLAVTLLHERTNWIGITGILLSLIALPLFDYKPGGLAAMEFESWFVLSLIVMIFWGAQAYLMRAANRFMSAEGIFSYMTMTGLMLAPIAFLMTDFSMDINWGWDGPLLAAAIQILNAIGALFLVYAFRYGKAIVVSPMTNAGAPLMTAIISLTVLGVVPTPIKIVAIVTATIAACLLALAPETPDRRPANS